MALTALVFTNSLSFGITLPSFFLNGFTSPELIFFRLQICKNVYVCVCVYVCMYLCVCCFVILQSVVLGVYIEKETSPVDQQLEDLYSKSKLLMFTLRVSLSFDVKMNFYQQLLLSVVVPILKIKVKLTANFRNIYLNIYKMYVDIRS